ncbi:hypothetical protein RRG08_055796 [Elysia crispata]|uniref:Uncharacterized protein n=1 Tax=Elysia crispata TaxID=231223 RepID=A0AAE0XSF2_9GAST|nr:hypothetical protein RRG08_055796 [Elysia crispata]
MLDTPGTVINLKHGAASRGHRDSLFNVMLGFRPDCGCKGGETRYRHKEGVMAWLIRPDVYGIRRGEAEKSGKRQD